MGHVKLIVDHEKIDYSGPVDINDLFRMIELFLWERGFDFKKDKDFEHHTDKGKFLEWQVSPWKWISDYIRYIIKIRVIGHDLLKTNAVNSGKKTKVDSGRIIIVIDGFIDYDLQTRWEQKPILHFLRAIYDNFIHKAYTERFEQMLTHDVHHLMDQIEKLLNLYKHYKVISKPAH